MVWRGEHIERNIPVAVKLLTGDGSRSGAFRAAFRGEVEAVASLSHQGIVLVLDYGTVTADEAARSGSLLSEGTPFLAMELASLGSIGGQPAGMRWPEAQAALRALLEALAHAHARGVVHRDLKPSNVLVAGPADLRPGLKLSDFGIASVAHRDERRRISGTPPYMAPEQFRGDPLEFGPWTDLYALGCMAWEWVTGAPPFGEGRPMRLAHRHLYDEPPALQPRFAVPAELEAWLRRLLEKAPEHRFQLAADARWALAQLGPPTARGTTRLPVLSSTAVTVDTLDDLLGGPTRRDRTVDDLVIELPDRAEPAPSTVPPAPIVHPPLLATWEQPEGRTDLRVLQASLSLYGLRAVPLVGRHAERDRLWAALHEVHRLNAPRVVLLQGQAGVGKSALASWLCERVHETGAATPLRAHHSRYGGPGQGLAAMFARHLQVRGLTTAAIVDRLQRYLRQHGRRDPIDAAALAALLSTQSDLDDEPHPALSTARERYALYATLLLTLASDRPLVLWIDDAHWGPEALDFLAWVLDAHRDLPVLFVLTVQLESLPEAPSALDALQALQRRQGVRSVQVPPLPEPDARALVQRLLRLDVDLSEAVVRRTGGNPLFTVQLLGDWVQRGLLRPSARGLELLPRAEAPLPDDLYDVWATRLERVLYDQPEMARCALELAAALGDSVQTEEWTACCEHEGVAAPPGLVSLLVRSRLAQITPDGWRFAHGMLRETVERLSREAGRWQHHNRAAAAVIGHRRGTPGRVARLGRYLLEAGEPDLAASALLESARRRMQKDEARRSADLLEIARLALERSTRKGPDGRKTIWLLLRSKLLKARQDLDEAWAAVREVEETARAHGWGRLEAEALAEQADIARVRGDFPAARRLFEHALLSYRELDDPQGVADTLRSLSAVSIQLGNPDGAEHLLQDARDAYTLLGDRFGAAMCLAGLGDIARVRRRWDEATRWFRESLTVLRALGHRSGVALGLHGLAEVQRLTGHLEEARQGYLQVIDLDAALGRDNTISRLNLTLCDIARGDYDGAAESLRELEHLWSVRGRPGYLAIVHIAQLPCAAARGAWPVFHRHLAVAVPLLHECSLVDLDVARLAELAGALASRAGRPKEARAAWDVALDQWTALHAEQKVEELLIALEHLPPTARAPRAR